jgi:hypothetical protein
VATEAAWLNGNNLKKETTKKRKKQKERLDTHRPSHGRSWRQALGFIWESSVAGIAVVAAGLLALGWLLVGAINSMV